MDQRYDFTIGCDQKQTSFFSPEVLPNAIPNMVSFPVIKNKEWVPKYGVDMCSPNQVSLVSESTPYLKCQKYLIYCSIYDQLLCQSMLSLAASLLRLKLEVGRGYRGRVSAFSDKLELKFLKYRQSTLTNLINHLDMTIGTPSSYAPDAGVIHSLIISSLLFQFSGIAEDATLASYIQVHKGIIALLQIFDTSKFETNGLHSPFTQKKIYFLKATSYAMFQDVTNIFTPPYDNSIFVEVHNNLLELQHLFPYIQDDSRFQALVSFIRDLLPIFEFFKKDNISKYPRSVIFSLLKKWYKLYPIDSRNATQAIQILDLYYELVSMLLNHVFPECKYLFLLQFNNTSVMNPSCEDITEYMNNADASTRHFVYIRRVLRFLKHRENFYRGHFFHRKPFFDNSVFNKETGKILSLKKPVQSVKETFITRFNTSMILPNNYPHYDTALYRSNVRSFNQLLQGSSPEPLGHLLRDANLKLKSTWFLEFDYEPVLQDDAYQCKAYYEEACADHLRILYMDRQNISVEV